MKLIWATLFFLSLTCFAEIINSSRENDQNPSKPTRIIMETLFSDIGIESKTPPPPIIEVTPTPSIIDNQPKIIVDDKPIVKKDEVIAPTPAPITPTLTPTRAPEKISDGENKIQEMLKKNKEALKKQREDEKDASFKKKYYGKNNDFYAGLREENNQELSKLKKQNDSTLKQWNDEIKKTRANWDKMHKEFLKNIKQYQNNTYNLEEYDEKLKSASVTFASTPLTLKDVDQLRSNDYRLIKGAMDIPIRNQGKRPTCAAFSGIRALEVLLKSNGMDNDLSEQYFYWASRPTCQVAPCSSKGSWAAAGFDQSVQSRNPDIPLEKFCPYKEMSVNNNETQIPLKSTCQEGFVKVNQYKRIETLGETIKSLDEGKPVIAGFKLSPNFYLSNGFITYKGSLTKGGMDSHAEGHAILLIGYIPLPEKYKQDEGSVCFIAANSWGEGWGRGGYSCLSEKWVTKQKVKNAFLSVISAIAL